MIFASDDLIYNLVTVGIAIFLLVIGYYKYAFHYWERKGIEYIKPSIPFGNVKQLFLREKSFAEQFADVYKEFKKRETKHGGVFVFTRPFYVPLSPVIIKDILQTNFSHFTDRGVFNNEERDPLSAHLFALEGAKWKNLRSKLTSTFTSGKMKMMFETMANCAKELNVIINDAAINNKPLSIKDTLARFTTDVITSCAFGIEGKSLKEPNSEIRHIGRRAAENTTWEGFKQFAQFLIDPRILEAIRFKATKVDVENFILKLVKDVVEYRENNNIYRKDFLHLLLQIKNRGKISDDESILEDNTSKEVGFTLNEVAAQVFVFFVAGYETSATTMTFTLYELSLHQNIQDKLRNEINTVLKKHNGETSYEALMEMTYLDQVINEALRKYPPVAFLNRKCTKKYNIKNTDKYLDEGTLVVIPTLGIHYDPDIYPEPSKFDPDRFSEDNRKTRPACTFLPFGEGPRICIGLRFGLLQSKLGLVTLLKNHRVTLSSQTTMPLVMNKQNLITSLEGEIYLNVSKV